MPYNTDILLQLQYIGIIRRILVYPTSWDWPVDTQVDDVTRIVGSMDILKSNEITTLYTIS